MPPTTIGRRPAATSAVDLRVGEAGELARGRAAGHRQDAEQPVLEPRPLLRRRGAREDLQPAVELQRVGGDRHRVLAALAAQALGHRDGDGGLADAGRAEDRDEGQRGRHGA